MIVIIYKIKMTTKLFISDATNGDFMSAGLKDGLGLLNVLYFRILYFLY